MFNHLVLGTDDMAAARKFYDATLAALGVARGRLDPRGRLYYAHDGSLLVLAVPINGEPATHANGGTLGFRAASAEAVDAWHAAGLVHGGTSCEAAPGLRDAAGGQLYAAYLRDPTGNKLCAIHRSEQGHNR